MGFIHKPYGFHYDAADPDHVCYCWSAQRRHVVVGLLNATSQNSRSNKISGFDSKCSRTLVCFLTDASSDIQTVFTGGNPLDPWGNTVVYLFDNNLTAAAASGICGRTSTNLTVNGTPNIAFALLSTAGDAFQSTWTGVPAFSTTVFTYPATALGTTATLATGDLFKIVTLEELKNRAGCYGGTQGQLKILNNELPKGCWQHSLLCNYFRWRRCPHLSDLYHLETWLVLDFQLQAPALPVHP